MNLVIYHGNCADGFGAAYAAHRAMPEAEFYPGKYQESPPDVTGKIVYMLDFSYKRPVMLELAKQADKIIVIDHHLSAMKDLEGITHEANNVHTTFNMIRSGAVLAWEHFNSGTPIPALFEYIQDRDLWWHKLTGTHEVSAAIFSYPYDFETWDGLVQEPIENLIKEGMGILRKQRKDLGELLPQVTRHMRIGGFLAKIANLPYMFASEAGHILSEGTLFGGTYFDTPEGRNFSLRSHEGGADVSEIAKGYGGGGHKHAAGFRVPRDHDLAKV